DAAELQELSSHISGRPVWCAASTHQGEEAQVLEAHRAVLRNFHRSLLILVPRHPDRGAELLKTLRSDGWKVCTRSEHRRPDSDCQIFLADSLGEMGLWYRLAPISFVGGSLMPIGGHNPFEPAALGSAVITGPHTANFRDIFTRLDAAGASVTVESGAGLGETVIDLMKPDRRAPMALAAWEVASRGADVTDRVMRLIQDHLPKSTDDPDNASHPTPQRAQA
ncbi:MAG: 3-deoxy-D-manno-octulosonic acid transferase, partial [Mangrovicoccus sp.]